MKTDKRILKSSIIGSALLSGAVFGLNVNAADMFEYNALGSGAELRSDLMEKNSSVLDAKDAIFDATTFKFSEANCGEGKKAEKKSDKKSGDAKAESKAGESKCGEGKCGEKKSDKKADKKKDEAKPAESKSGESK